MTAESELRTSVNAKVYVIEDWSWVATEWTEITDARFVRCQRSLSHSIPSASFETSAGSMLFAGGPVASVFADGGTDPNDYLDWWVRIDADFAAGGSVDFRWFGVLTDVVSRFAGGKVVDYQVNCLGLEYLLTRKQITESITQEGADPEKIVARAIAFNEGSSTFAGRTRVGGNFNGETDVTKFAFSNSPWGLLWSSLQMMQYLIHRYPPTTTPAWHLDDDALGDNGADFQDMLDSLEFYGISVDTDGRTLFELYNTIISRRRGLTWYIRVDEINEKILIVPRTTTPIDVTVDTDTIYKNPKRFTMDFTGEQEVLDFRCVASSKPIYQRVRVRGARKGMIATFTADQELKPVWDAGDETRYATAASAAPGYGSMFVGEKAELNDSVRNTEDYNYIFTEFRLPSNWNGELYTGEVVIDPSVVWLESLKFENYVPLFKGVDYTTDPANPAGAPTSDYIQPPIVIDDGSATFHYADNLSALAFTETWGDGIHFSCSVEIASDEPTIKIRSNTVPHQMAYNSFNPATAEPSGYSPQVDWKTIEATLYFLTDEYCEAFAPIGPVLPSHDQIAELVIDIGDRARLDELVENTVLSIDTSGGKVFAGARGFVNDDRGLCQAIANAAMIVHGDEYKAIQITLGMMDEPFAVGTLITTFKHDGADITVNTIVSLITWDFERNTTSIETQMLELDVTAI